MFRVRITPYLNNNNEYIKILVIDPKPIGKLIEITKQINKPKLSPFQTNTNCTPNCIFAIMDLNDKNKFMCVENITDLYNFLFTNGYTINNDFTKLMLKVNIDPNSQLLFYFN